MDSHIMKMGVLTDLDEANLFDVAVEVGPHVIMDEEEISDDVSADSADSVMEFDVFDLVWSKIPSYPWWPGQICDPAASSIKAMKYFRTGKYLIAFFGDHTFAWKEAAMIKPFQEYFLELQNQNKLESFHQAIDCALEEFSRRVEFSLACSCLSEEVYSKLQTQTLTNAGTPKMLSKRVGGDSFLTAASFDPMKLIYIVKELAMSPFGEADKLELVRARAQLLAFNRWKGYGELPKFDKHNVVFNDIDHILDVKNDYQSESMEDIGIDIKHDEAALSGELKTQDNSVGKCMDNSEHLKDSSTKGTFFLNSMAKEPGRSWKKKHRSEQNDGYELNLHASSTKDEVCTSINIPIALVDFRKTGQTCKVGDSIQKVAELNESNPILKHEDGISLKVVSKTRRGRKRIQETSELVSGGNTGNKLTKTKKRINISASVKTSESEFIKDTYWTDRLIQGIAEDRVYFENQNENMESHVQTPSERVIHTGVNSTNQDKPHEHMEPDSENSVEDPYPTALILTFTDFDSIPSEPNLNDIFRKYGPLYESKTEVMKKSRRAKVVFKRTADAETAFSSTGKYSIFGTALIGYRLKFLPPAKVSLRRRGRPRKEANLKNELLST
ncbi:putative oxidoreductase GLYR1, partial [Cucurbita argyrosperma subsp. argyrosperma]